MYIILKGDDYIEMKKNNILVTAVLMAVTAAAVCLPAAAQEQEPESVIYENQGFRLSVPEEYADLMQIEVPEDDEKGILFAFSEKASIEAAKASGQEADGAGWLFSIGVVDEDTMHEMLCSDMLNDRVIATDGEENHYICYHPSDVRFVREQYDHIDEDLAQWSMLNEWASTVPEAFVEENEGLEKEMYSNSDVSIFLARAAYMDGANYTISTTEYGPMQPNGVDAVPFVEQLIKGTSVDYVDDEEAPDGEYVVLSFPDEDERYDFFLMPEKENYIRRTWNEEENEQMYKITFDDDSKKASAIMKDWYHALVDAAGDN